MGRYSYVETTMVVMAVVMIMTTVPVTAHNNPFCQCARLKPLCNKMVKGATNYHDALKNALQSTLDLNKKDSKQLVPMMTSIAQKTNSPSKGMIFKNCHEKVVDAAGYIRDLIKAADEDDKDMIEYYLRTGEITLRDCVDSITEINMPIPPELSKLAQDVEDYKETALVVFLQAPIESIYNKPMPAEYSG